MASTSIVQIKVGDIPDVQELQKSKPTTIPERFIRATKMIWDVESPSFAGGIPVIDLQNLSNGNNKTELNRLAKACEEWGFFLVTNHGIPSALLESMEVVSKEFFMLPLEEKKKYPMKPGTVQGYGQAFVFSEEQKLDWCDMFALGLHPPSIRNPSLWPTRPSSFGPTIEAYSNEISKLCGTLLEHIAATLGLPENAFEEIFGEYVQAVRMNYYPPCERPDLVMGLSAHSDGSALTVLREVKGGPVGLQVMKDGKWVPVHGGPNALVVNIGDTMEVVTNGKYRSVEHRAVTHREEERVSIVMFYAPSYEVELEPMKEFVSEDNPCKFRRYNHGEYSRHYVSNKLRGKKNLDFASI